MISWGGAVEVDETYVGGRETGVVGRQTKTKSIVAIAAEVRGRGHWPDPNEPRRGCGCEEPDPVCPNNRGAWRDRPNRWLVSLQWSGEPRAMTTSRDPFPPVATRPTSSCHECIAWPLCLIAGGWASTMVPSMPTISTTISTSSLSDSIAAVRRLVACFSSDCSSRRCSTSRSPTKGLVGGHRSLGNQM